MGDVTCTQIDEEGEFIHYVLGFMLLGSPLMGMHYEISNLYTECFPHLLLLDPKTPAPINGSKIFSGFLWNSTAIAPSHLNYKKTIPTVFDDPNVVGK